MSWRQVAMTRLYAFGGWIRVQSHCRSAGDLMWRMLINQISERSVSCQISHSLCFLVPGTPWSKCGTSETAIICWHSQITAQMSMASPCIRRDHSSSRLARETLRSEHSALRASSSHSRSTFWPWHSWMTHNSQWLTLLRTHSQRKALSNFAICWRPFFFKNTAKKDMMICN